ncbi:MAG TPA: (d)CMP kinase [Savagea sp.]|mgnify:CR=1 FL=1
MKNISIAIDGPAAAGKSTIAKRVANALHYTYVDTGAMYRAATWLALQHDVDLTNDEEIVQLLERSGLELRPSESGQRVIVHGEDVSEAIRSERVTNAVSRVATLPNVRRYLGELQRALGQRGGIVMDGRDIGTSVLPHAELKIFMTASVEERAERRYLENKKRGIETSLSDLKREIEKRDKMDMERAISPLTEASDAVRIDTTGRTIDEVASEIERLANEKVSR